MIDIHSHILPNIDDGSRSIEETFNLIKEAEEAGFEKIVSTSHYMKRYYEVEEKERLAWVNAIQEGLKKQKIKVDLYLGSEIYFSHSIIDLLEEGKASTINNTRYVLFEFPINAKPMNIYDIVYQMLEHKLIPILAHPERYTFVHEDPEIIYNLVEKGALMQCNYASITGYYGKRPKMIIKKLLENDMVHFLGSDVHRQETIYKRMPEILTELENIIGKEKLNELTTKNPELILENKRIETSSPKHIKLSIKDKIFMNLK